MKVHSLHDENGKLRAFEVTSTWVRMDPLLKILISVSGVSDVKRSWFNDDRVSFKYHGYDCVVNEPWGDNSRYWVGVISPTEYKLVDFESVAVAFKSYKGFTLL
ncbi:hypothetical protein [Pelagibaculum spongiae]|uniref:Uncharacterized protein n=1 Tax=Pelagibaculum spongiae TaxID=2080658 RepID=A0A2V1H2X5_9GAMM|nr:hypothetical protein [Pelagibaculum spongiae]PVZ70359.1 hypothetical protein DC094_07130 [Pelagibaculum spongiae]